MRRAGNQKKKKKKTLLSLPKPSVGILREYLDESEWLSPDNITPEITLKVEERMRKVHQAGILHRDPLPRNSLVQRASGRVVRIDFDSAKCTPEFNIPSECFESEMRSVKYNCCDPVTESPQPTE
jgi:serine/threonine protein kinase